MRQRSYRCWMKSSKTALSERSDCSSKMSIAGEALPLLAKRERAQYTLLQRWLEPHANRGYRFCGYFGLAVDLG
jgi:hypothetical protein